MFEKDLVIDEPVEEVVVKKDPDHVLMLAASLIEHYGWVQHKYGNEMDGYCLAGAVGKAMNMLGEVHDIGHWKRVTALVPASEVIVWNDTEGRTKQEVIDVLMRAARS